MVIRRDKLMNDPQREFKTPRRVLEDQDLSTERKIALLMNWRADLLELQRADSENMQRAEDDSGDIALQLAEVVDALESLGADPETGSIRR